MKNLINKQNMLVKIFLYFVIVTIMIFFNGCGEVKYKISQEYNKFEKDISIVLPESNDALNVFPSMVTPTHLVYYEVQNSNMDDNLVRQFYLYDLKAKTKLKIEGDYGDPSILSDGNLLWVGRNMVITLTDESGKEISSIDLKDAVEGLTEYSVVLPKISYDKEFYYLNVDYTNLVVLDKDLKIVNTVKKIIFIVSFTV